MIKKHKQYIRVTLDTAEKVTFRMEGTCTLDECWCEAPSKKANSILKTKEKWSSHDQSQRCFSKENMKNDSNIVTHD